MRILKLFPAALAMVALASCSNNDLFDFDGSKAVDGKTMNATIEEFRASTRAAFAENKNDEGKVDARELVWTAGDSYKVYGELATPDKYTLQNASAGKANGTFDLMTEDYNENPAFAVFPYDGIDADRASKKLTVNLNDWAYGTAEVKDKGFNQGAFISNVPMFGKISAGDPKSAAFGYMTALLRVDLSKLPKRTTRLFIITDRPLTGEFETEFDLEGAYPEIVSPKGDEAEYSTVNIKGVGDVKGYILAISTEPIAQRTNKTFFIPVPTGNKYNKFDIYVEYNMAGSTETELIEKLGNADRPGKILNWQRGKIKSLTREITVTASGNTPQEISAFLKDEWKSFPEGDEINITVAAPTASIDLSDAAKNTFTVPAELKNKVVNIIAEGYTGTKKLTIVDEDKAPVASAALRKINFIVPGDNTGFDVEIDAPETQIEFDGTVDADGNPVLSTYKTFNPVTVAIGDIANEAAGLTIGENAEVTTAVILNGGSFLSEGEIAGFNNKGNNDALIKNNANNVYCNGNGALTVAGQLDENGNIVNTLGTIFARGAGAISVENVEWATVADDKSTATGAITINNVKGAIVTVNNEKHDAPVNITKVTESGATVNYNGLNAVTVDDIIGDCGGFVCYNPKATGDLTVTNLATAKDATVPATVTAIEYYGTGNVEVTGVINNKKVYPVVTTATISTSAADPRPASNVTFKDVTIGTTLTKFSTGALTIDGVHATFGKLTNREGDVTITGSNAAEADITLLTQQKEGNIILKDLSNPEKGDAGKLVKLILGKNGQKSVTYENTFIGTLQNLQADEKVITEVNGTKSSGIGVVDNVPTANNNYTTDVWDGTSYAKLPSQGVYTSAQLAALIKLGIGDVTLNVSNSTIDLGGHAFQLPSTPAPITGIKNDVTSLVNAVPGSNAFVIKNLKATTGLFANRTADLIVKKVTVENAEITATKNAGTIIGQINGGAVKFTNVTVKNATIAATSTGTGDDINLGGMVGNINGAAATFTVENGLVDGASIKGHYWMGGIIGCVTNAKAIYLYGEEGKVKDDGVGTETKNLTFTPVSADGKWATQKSGTIAPFIGGIQNLSTKLQIYGECTPVDRKAMKWDWNFLNDEHITFKGTKRDDINFIGYTKADSDEFEFALKLKSGFEANPQMTRRNTTATSAILDTEYNVYVAD